MEVGDKHPSGTSLKLLSLLDRKGLEALATGAKERRFMAKKIIYTDETLGDVAVIADFLPAPADLALRDDVINITLALSKSSVDPRNRSCPG